MRHRKRLGRRASYRYGVEWIALNDDPATGDDVEVVAGYISTCLLADLFDVPREQVARDIIIFRQKEAEFQAHMDRESWEMENRESEIDAEPPPHKEDF